MKLLSPEQLATLESDELALYSHQLEYELAKRSPLDLACWLSPETVRTPHLEYVNDRIVALVEHRLYHSGPGPAANWFYRDRETGSALPALGPDHIPVGAVEFWGEHPEDGEHVVYKLGIAIPPRHGKSWIVTEHLPLWYWMRHPDADIAFATYSETFAETWGKKLRSKLQENVGKMGLKLAGGDRHNSSHLYFSNTRGNMFLVGTGGPLTGRGWQLGIIDDPLKDAAEALSQATRNSVSDWYAAVFDTRDTRMGFDGLPVQIMMFTRWHEDDPAGRFIYDDKKQVNSDWHMIRLPALAIDDDPLGREPGEALWSAVKTRAELLKIQVRDPMWFSAMFQGNPTMGDQGMFPRWYMYTNTKGVYTWEDHDGIHRVDSADCVRFATVDTAYTRSTWSDYSVFSCWDFDRGTQRLFLVDRDRVRVESPALRSWIEQLNKKWNPKFIGIEDVATGKALIQEIRRHTNITFRPLKADRDKVSRALGYGQAAANGLILLPKGAEWITEWIEEHSAFPYGKHDDQVDTGSYAHIVSQTMGQIVADDRNLVDMSFEGKVERYQEKLDRKAKRKNRHRGTLSGNLGR